MREKEGQLRLRSQICLQGTEIPFCISECLYYLAAGGDMVLQNVSFLLVDAVPLGALIILPTGLQRNSKLLLCLVMGEQGLHCLSKWTLSWIADQVSPPTGKCICCQVTECLSYAFSLLVINIKLFCAKGILSNMDVLRLASQSTLWLKGEGALWKEGGVVFMSVQGAERFELSSAVSQWSPRLSCVFFLLAEKDHLLHLTQGKHCEL